MGERERERDFFSPKKAFFILSRSSLSTFFFLFISFNFTSFLRRALSVGNICMEIYAEEKEREERYLHVQISFGKLNSFFTPLSFHSLLVEF